MSTWIQLISLAALTGTALIGGLLFAFSVCVMRALSRLEPQAGMRAMQEINRVILNPIFLLSFIGTALLSLVIILAKIIGVGDVPFPTFCGALLYVLGAFIITAAGNVPLNNKLDTIDPECSTDFWQIYLKKWVPLNHLRTIACTLAVISYGIGFIQI